jgi:hypothetical protein
MKNKITWVTIGGEKIGLSKQAFKLRHTGNENKEQALKLRPSEIDSRNENKKVAKDKPEDGLIRWLKS